ncbi:DUF2382 domain-containing protein [Oscillatoria sp. CS-180]|uniref:DUF2382 domain-containing protein n=1 Tax=Oscillatoria sp. CS-180 TaxID=3021720 RepID=UPI00232AB2B9|nr:DUF2382 domain-containing protein [Oscillatoria sp. CS-180]MDB9524844.1 DUF2382 domain-containing protein [Oscillatoria sp. CS-180]
MALTRFKDAYPNHRATFGDGNDSADFSDYSVYAQGDDKVGTIQDALFENETGNIRYLIVDTGFWIFGKQILLPIGLASFDYSQKRVYVNGLTKEQVENMPAYDDNTVIDRNYEDRVRAGYRTMGENRKRQFMGKEYNVDKYRAYPGSASLYGVTEQPAGTSTAVTGSAAADVDLYDYDNEPGLFGMDEGAHQPIRLYQERLIADKDRFKAGTVSVGKRVETTTQEASVPVENERVVIERTTPTGTTPVAGTPDFREGEVARVETYGEKADIRKEAFVREEVNVRKEVDRDVVTGEETIRREELDVDTTGNPDVIKK